MTTRLTVEERKAFAQHARASSQWPPKEPALGTLAQRLDILVTRLGGRLRPERPTAEELASVGTW